MNLSFQSVSPSLFLWTHILNWSWLISSAQQPGGDFDHHEVKRRRLQDFFFLFSVFYFIKSFNELLVSYGTVPFIRSLQNCSSSIQFSFLFLNLTFQVPTSCSTHYYDIALAPFLSLLGVVGTCINLSAFTLETDRRGERWLLFVAPTVITIEWGFPAKRVWAASAQVRTASGPLFAMQSLRLRHSGGRRRGQS